MHSCGCRAARTTAEIGVATCQTAGATHLALEAARQQDEHGAGGDAGPQLGGAADHAASQGLGRILCSGEQAGGVRFGGRRARHEV